MIKLITIILLVIITTIQAHSLKHCIHHVLHQTGNEDFTCKNNQQINFYSNYVLPDGAYRCLDQMKGKKGFYVTTVKSFGEWNVTPSQFQDGVIIKKQIVVKGWKCSDAGIVKETQFRGVELKLSTCRHNSQQFQDLCITMGWPLQQINDQQL